MDKIMQHFIQVAEGVQDKSLNIHLNMHPNKPQQKQAAPQYDII